MLFFIAGAKDVAQRYVCGEEYASKRKLKSGRRNYRSECGDAGIPVKDSKQHQRARRSEALRLSKTEMVEKWLRDRNGHD